MKIVVADGMPDAALELLRAEGWEVDTRRGRTPEELAAALHDADALIVRSATKVTAALLSAAPALRAVARAGTGVDNVDVAAATARGILVMNAPGANSVSVAELAIGLILALARRLPAADASMKEGRWEKRELIGEELRGKTLGLVGLGRIGREVAGRAAAFSMRLIAHDPFISGQAAASIGAELVSLDELFTRADYVSLHAPSNEKTRHLVNRERLRAARRGIRIVNTARGDLVDEAALAEAIEAGHVAGAAIDVFGQEPPADQRLQKLPQVIATPHIAASTREGQALVGAETAAALHGYLRHGVIRNAVNFPSLPVEELARLRPFLDLGERLGAFVAQTTDARPRELGVRYYGDLSAARNEVLVDAVLVGLFSPVLSSRVNLVNARTVAAERGIDLVESRSSRVRPYTGVLSVTLDTSEGTRWVEGAVFNLSAPRLVLVDGIAVDAPLAGTMIVVCNNDEPGVIGEVGTILGRHGVNIANFALGRDGAERAVGVVNVDEPRPIPEAVLAEIVAVPAIREARLVRLP
ncbi:MAG: phosphoglycerate dehydrogenase [Acidobacteria bacterium]|nr:phosphoglycerate dehydrogenase [Acidobacteriota bacterium]